MSWKRWSQITTRIDKYSVACLNRACEDFLTSLTFPPAGRRLLRILIAMIHLTYPKDFLLMAKIFCLVLVFIALLTAVFTWSEFQNQHGRVRGIEQNCQCGHKSSDCERCKLWREKGLKYCTNCDLETLPSGANELKSPCQCDCGTQNKQDFAKSCCEWCTIQNVVLGITNIILPC
jgi:hypothetical protein